MTVLVTAASRRGSTGEIADRIAAGLTERGLAVEVKTPDDVPDAERYTAFVIGSAVYMGGWLKAAKGFVEANAGEISRRPSWLFSSGPIVEDPSAGAGSRDRAEGDGLAKLVNAREHKVFVGKLDRSQLSFAEKAIVHLVHAPEGDNRDWPAIDDWAATIARELKVARAPSEVPAPAQPPTRVERLAPI